MQLAKDFKEAVLLLDSSEVMRVFSDHYLMEYLPQWRLCPIERASYDNNFYPYVSNFAWESDRTPVTVHHPKLEKLEQELGLYGILATGHPVRPTINVVVADHPVHGWAARVHIVLVVIPEGEAEHRVIDALAVIPLLQRK